VFRMVNGWRGGGDVKVCWGRWRGRVGAGFPFGGALAPPGREGAEGRRTRRTATATSTPTNCNRIGLGTRLHGSARGAGPGGDPPGRVSRPGLLPRERGDRLDTPRGARPHCPPVSRPRTQQDEDHASEPAPVPPPVRPRPGRRRVRLCAGGDDGAAAGPDPGARGPRAPRAVHLAQPRPGAGRPVHRRGGPRRPDARVLLRRDRGRALEDHGRRHHLAGGDGWPDRERVRRGRGRLRPGPRRGLDGHGRGAAAGERAARRWRLPEHGCGEDVGARGAAGRAEHRARPDRPDRLQHGLGRGPRPLRRDQRRPGRLQDHGWRRDVGEGAVRGWHHGGGGPEPRPRRSRCRLRGHVGRVAEAMGPEERRAGERPVPDHGWRRELGEPGRSTGDARGRPGEDRGHRVAGGRPAGVRHHRSRGGRRLPER
jgi:hypothetical protein